MILIDPPVGPFDSAAGIERWLDELRRLTATVTSDDERADVARAIRQATKSLAAARRRDT